MDPHKFKMNSPEIEALVTETILDGSPYDTQEFAVLEQPETHSSDVSLAEVPDDKLKEGLRAANYRWFEGVDNGDPDLELRGEKVADACIIELARRQTYQTHHEPKNKLEAMVTKTFDKFFGS